MQVSKKAVLTRDPVCHVCHRMSIYKVVFSFTGAMHDKTAIEFSSKFLNFLNGLPSDVAVIGDAAYRGVHPQVIVPYTRNLSSSQEGFNQQITSLRQVVERSIGALQTKWRILQLKENRLPAKINVSFASKCFVACCVLHNKYTNYIS